MPLPHTTYATYKTLRDLDITPKSKHPEIDGTWRLGHTASWSRWGDTTGDLAPITASSEVEFQRLPPFTTAVVLLAINWGGNAMGTTSESWRNFHAQGHRGDGTLKNTFALTQTRVAEELPALYMTDVFKLVPTETASKLSSKIKLDLKRGFDHVDRCAGILREELTLCKEGAGNNAPTLVAIGDAAFSWLSGHEEDRRIAEVVDEVLGTGASARVRRMDHYTFGSGTHESRSAVLQSVLEQSLDPSFGSGTGAGL